MQPFTRRFILAASLGASLSALGCGNSLDKSETETATLKTVNVVLFANPGAPVDVWFRSLGPYLKKHLPDNPRVNFVNKPGAGSMIAANYLANAVKNDGLTVGTFNANAMDKAARGDSSAKIDLGALIPIGSLRKGRVISTNVKEIKNFDDVLASDRELIMGMEADATPYYKAFSELTGMNLRIISSYTNGTQTMQAFRTGEVDAMPISTIEWLAIKDSVTEDGGSELFQLGYVNEHNEVVGVDYVKAPTGHDIVRQLNPGAVGSPQWDVMTLASAGQSVSDEVWAPAQTPQYMIKIWRQAFERAVRDPDFVSSHEKAFGIAPHWTTGPQMRTIVDGIMNIYSGH